MENEIASITYMSLEQGLLTGKITSERQFNKNDWRSNAGQWLPWFKRENLERLLSMFLQWEDLLDKYHCSMAQLTVAWTAAQPGISHVLCGAKSVSQIIKNADSGSITLSEGEINRMSNDIKSLGEPI
ncbi:MAG: aldo/keto reductase [Porticoccaceae bacterium]